jgi:parallel beta-helix repeat protein
MFFYGDITGLLVDSCVGEYNGGMGFSLFDSTDTTSVTNVVFRNNTIRYNGAGGIECSLQHFANWLIDSNVIYQNSQISTDSTGALLTGQAVYAGGIDLNSLAQAGGSGTVISNNQVYNNGMVNGKPSPYPSQGVGIWSDTTTGMKVQNNFTYGNSGPGLLCEKTLNSTWSYNVSYNDSQYALTFSNDSNGLGSLHVVADEATNGGGNLFVNNTIYGGWLGIAIFSTDTSKISNNIFRNNIAVAAAGHNFWAGAGGNNDGTGGSGNIYDHNAFGVAGPLLAYWNALGAITTYSSLDSAYGSAMNNLQADPLLTNPSAGNFTLQPGSPAIGAGVYIPGVSTVNPPNIGAK